jgi:hypothetical protein
MPQLLCDFCENLPETIRNFSLSYCLPCPSACDNTRIGDSDRNADVLKGHSASSSGRSSTEGITILEPSVTI